MYEKYLFIANIHPRVDESMLKELFKQVGAVEHLNLNTSRNTAVVEFESEADVLAAILLLGRTKLYDRRLELSTMNDDKLFDIYKRYMESMKEINISPDQIGCCDSLSERDLKKLGNFNLGYDDKYNQPFDKYRSKDGNNYAAVYNDRNFGHYNVRYQTNRNFQHGRQDNNRNYNNYQQRQYQESFPDDRYNNPIGSYRQPWINHPNSYGYNEEYGSNCNNYGNPYGYKRKYSEYNERYNKQFRGNKRNFRY